MYIGKKNNLKYKLYFTATVEKKTLNKELTTIERWPISVSLWLNNSHYALRSIMEINKMFCIY